RKTLSGVSILVAPRLPYRPRRLPTGDIPRWFARRISCVSASLRRRPAARATHVGRHKPFFLGRHVSRHELALPASPPAHGRHSQVVRPAHSLRIGLAGPSPRSAGTTRWS